MGQRAAARKGRSRRRSRSSTVRRRSTGSIVLLGLCLALMSVGGGAALAHWKEGRPTVTEAAAPTEEPEVSPLMSPKASPKPSASPSPSQSPSKSPTSSPEPKASPPSSQSSAVPRSGPGTFTAARANGAPAGEGTLRRYKVEVEDGIDVSAREAAAQIQEILAHPRGWAANGRGRFQLVSSDADFVIKIATPSTADKLCLAVGLNTRGELNCETAEGVVVNLRRWLLGSPTFAGTPAEYRHLIINHEIGHEIGIRTHMGCPGAGKPAPVMMQQIKGLNGCVSNAWPFDEDGTYLTGPPA
ncbi:DUF3152 domain-containing protein [Streptomyces sp. NPDC096176]|uniref:DUF3152 domain-containing protein n=1 Tax=Streptomyces sp. NPDC096176 TaxID=3366079 RepID=UPI0038142DA4